MIAGVMVRSTPALAFCHSICMAKEIVGRKLKGQSIPSRRSGSAGQEEIIPHPHRVDHDDGDGHGLQAAGKITWKKARRGRHPSMAAQSSSSLGTVFTNR